MDRISQLPDELLLRILSNFPCTKDIVVTMFLSKRWQYLWKLVPKLVYDYSYQNVNHRRFSRFVDRSLFMHEAPAVETLSFKLGKSFGSGDIQVWIRAADKRCPRELFVEFDTCSRNENPVTLPRSLYTCCRKLVTLKLSNAILVDDVSSPISFPSLKNLSLKSMKYPDDNFINRFLSRCPVLEDLDVKLSSDDVDILSVRIPSLKSLVLHTRENREIEDANGFVIDAPNLECLKIDDDSGGFCLVESDMPKIVKAHVHSTGLPALLLKSITSAKRLRLCLQTSGNVSYPVGYVFHRLEHLTLCTCETEWLDLLLCVLIDSPNLRALKLEQYHSWDEEPRRSWIEPSSVPECLLTSLETLEWVGYEGTEEEKQVAAFILRNGICLKKVTINPKFISRRKKLKMVKELLYLPRCSSACRLAFD